MEVSAFSEYFLFQNFKQQNFIDFESSHQFFGLMLKSSRYNRLSKHDQENGIKSRNLFSETENNTLD